MVTESRRSYLVLRAVRRAALRVVNPVDHAANLLTGKTPFPPLYMRREVGNLSTFEMAAGEALTALELLAGFRPASTILDIGCGCGALPLALRSRRSARMSAPPSGQYLGLDVDRRMVRWCHARLADPYFAFSHYDYHNASYNPSGQRFLPFPAEDGWADVVALKSVITHMIPSDVEFYLKEVCRVLKPQGSALMTAFLYDAGDRSAQDAFPHLGDGGNYRYAKAASPESGIALDRLWLRAAMAEAGLCYEERRGAQQLLLVRHLDGCANEGCRAGDRP